MTLPYAQKLVFAIGLIAIPISNGVLAHSYTGQFFDSILAAAWAVAPLVVLYWWAVAKSDSKAEQYLVFGSVSISVAFGLALFVGRVWKGLDIEPVTFMFPAIAPLLQLALQFALMLLVTLVDWASSTLTKSRIRR